MEGVLFLWSKDEFVFIDLWFEKFGFVDVCLMDEFEKFFLIFDVVLGVIFCDWDRFGMIKKIGILNLIFNKRLLFLNGLK